MSRAQSDSPAARCRCREAIARPPPLALAGIGKRCAAPAVDHRPLIALQPALTAGARNASVLRAASLQQTQRVLGNRAAQRAVRRLVAPPVLRGTAGSRSPSHDNIVVQRDDSGPLDLARQVLSSLRGDAAADEARVSSDSRNRAQELEDRGAAESAQLQGQSGAQAAALQGDAAVQGAQLQQQSAAQAAALQSQAGAQGAQLGAESAGNAAMLQHEAGASSTRLQTDLTLLEHTANSTEAAAAGELASDAAAMQGEAGAIAGAQQAQWGGLQAQTTSQVGRLTQRTQTLLDQKAALVNEYKGPGTHDPERFQQRWQALQRQIAPLEQEQASLGQVEDSSEAINQRAETIWGTLGRRGQALMGSVSQIAGGAWAALQSGWSAVQGSAAAALAGLQSRAGAAVSGLKALASRASSGLQGAATQAWTGVKGLATGAWSGLKERATGVWTALRSQATAAWTALQGLAGSVVGGLADKISGIVSRINGAVGRIISLLADAVGSMLSRLRTATASALAALRSRASAAWNAVKSLGSRAWYGLKSLGTRAWEGLKGLGTRAWEGLKSLGTRAWQGLKALGTRAWQGLKSLGQRAWNGLKSGWQWLKKKAQSAWSWLKAAWAKLKRKASQLWDWIKKKARQALAWLKAKWAWLKALVRKAWAWLKAKWDWLKRIVKITIRIPDQTLCKVHRFKPWTFVDLHCGRLPIVKKVVDPGIGPVELALFVQGDARATVSGTVGPCSLKNIAFTLQPLVSRYTGQADFHVGATAAETLKLTGTIGGTANYGGLIGLVGGGLEGTGTANALASFTAKPRLVYDSGKITTTVPLRLEFCLMPVIDLDAFVVAQLLAGQAPSAAPPAAPALPRPGPLPPGPLLPAPSLPVPAPARGGVAAAAPPEKVLKEWKARWHLARWSRRECWDAQARFTLRSGRGVPQIELDFSAKPVSMDQVIRSLFELPPLPGGGGGGVGPLGRTYACAICRCQGDPECGGGRIHTIWMGQRDCQGCNADAQSLCNHDPEFTAICDRNPNRPDGKKCPAHHSQCQCSDRETEDKCANRQKSLDVDHDAPKITHETEYPAPDGSGKARSDVGVGEKVTFMGSKAGKWSASGGTPRSAAGTDKFVWTAPNRANSVTIKLEADGKESSVTMNVIEPGSITATKKSEIGYPAGRQGAGMKLTFNYHPKTVSFGNCEAKEVSGPATNISGYFLSHGMPHWHDSGDTFFAIGKDNRDSATDTASFSGYPAPWDKGGWDWQIPNRFKVKTEGGDGKHFTTVTQAFSMTASGESTVDKAGASVTRSP